MTRSELIRAVANCTSLNQKQAREALDAFVDVMVLTATENEDTTIAGFGKFIVRDRPEAKRVNPGNGQTVTVPRRKTITFRASKAFRGRI